MKIEELIGIILKRSGCSHLSFFVLVSTVATIGVALILGESGVDFSEFGTKLILFTIASIGYLLIWCFVKDIHKIDK